MKPDPRLMSELCSLIARNVGVNETRRPLENIILRCEDGPSPPSSYIVEPHFAVIAQGAKRSVLADQVFQYAAGNFLIFSVDLPMSSYITRASAAEPFLGFGMTLKPDAIAALLLESGAPLKAAPDTAGFAVGDLTDDLLEPVVRMLRLLDRPQDVAVLKPMIEREILWRLIHSDLGTVVRQLGLVESRITRVGRAIVWLRNHYAEPVRVEDLADMVEMSVTSFHRHFLGVTAMSPLQYQKQVRLQEARSRLLSSSGDVGAIGLSVGYDSASQFSREYRRLFGAPPTRDMEQFRRARPE